MSKYYLVIDYMNYLGGVNNLQIAKVFKSGLGCLISFTSQNNQAEKYAKQWCIKNNIELD